MHENSEGWVGRSFVWTQLVFERLKALSTFHMVHSKSSVRAWGGK